MTHRFARLFFAMLFGAIFLSACKHEGSAIQKQYAADRKDCRQFAEMIMSRTRPNSYLPRGDEHIMLVTHFARCMHKRGWAVNTPADEKK